MSTMEKIRQHMAATPEGQPVSTRSLLAYGSRAAVDQALSRLVKQEYLIRPVRGVYVRPKYNAYVGAVPPSPAVIAEMLAQESGSEIQVHGAEAARRFGFSTQVPMRPIYYTNGPSRKLHFGKLRVELMHVSPRKMILAGRPAGTALTALRYLGRTNLTSKAIAQVESQLSGEEFRELLRVVPLLPGWLREAFYTHTGSHTHG